MLIRIFACERLTVMTGPLWLVKYWLLFSCQHRSNTRLYNRQGMLPLELDLTARPSNRSEFSWGYTSATSNIRRGRLEKHVNRRHCLSKGCLAHINHRANAECVLLRGRPYHTFDLWKPGGDHWQVTKTSLEMRVSHLVYGAVPWISANG